MLALFSALTAKGDVNCVVCKYVVPSSLFDEKEVRYIVHFNSQENTKKKKKDKDDEQADGPVIERKCPKCGHERMTYAPIRLRSADEGQTVFCTCLKCKYKESESS